MLLALTGFAQNSAPKQDYQLITGNSFIQKLVFAHPVRNASGSKIFAGKR